MKGEKMTKYAIDIVSQLKEQSKDTNIVLKVVEIIDGSIVHSTIPADNENIQDILKEPNQYVIGMTINAKTEEALSLDRIIVDTAKYVEDRMNGWGDDGENVETCIALQFDGGKRINSFNDAAFIANLQTKLPQGSEIKGAFLDQGADGKSAIIVKMVLTSVNMLRVLNDRLIRDPNSMKIILGDITFTPNASYFAEVYEATALKLNKLSEEQRKVIDDMRSSERPHAHITGPAGSGKTFIALHLALEVLRQDGNVLFVSRNEALGFFFAKWCLGRLRTQMTPKSAWERIERLFIVSTASGKTAISKCAFDASKSRISCSEIENDVTFALIIVDEAHNVYRTTSARRLTLARTQSLKKKNDTRALLEPILENKTAADSAAQVMLLSDASQSSADCVFPEIAGMQDYNLVNVSRCTQRIMLGAMAFQMGDDQRFETTANHEVPGKPLESVFFNLKDKPTRHEQYAEKIIKALENISDKHFEKGFSLHDRVAVICPDVKFSDGVRDALKKHSAYRFVAASEACANVTSFGAKADRPWIVVDAMDNFDGLERLIVIAAGLDGDTTSTDKRYLASRFYRALTRAHMLVVVVNEAIETGMLNFIHEVEYDSEISSRRKRPLHLTWTKLVSKQPK